jgi:general secretion pathway protein H
LRADAQEQSTFFTRHAKRHIPSRCEAGFTLIEIMVVIVIIAIAAAVVLPRLPSTEGTRLKNSARNLASGIRFLSDRSIVTKALYRLHLDMSDNSVRIAMLSPKREEQAPDDEFMSRKLLEDGISIEDVTAPGVGTVSEGEAVVEFGPAGLSEGLVVHLKGGDKQYTVIAYPFGGKVEVLEGYKELEVPT